MFAELKAGAAARSLVLCLDRCGRPNPIQVRTCNSKNRSPAHRKKQTQIFLRISQAFGRSTWCEHGSNIQILIRRKDGRPKAAISNGQFILRGRHLFTKFSIRNERTDAWTDIYSCAKVETPDLRVRGSKSSRKEKILNYKKEGSAHGGV